MKWKASDYRRLTEVERVMEDDPRSLASECANVARLFAGSGPQAGQNGYGFHDRTCLISAHRQRLLPILGACMHQSVEPTSIKSGTHYSSLHSYDLNVPTNFQIFDSTTIDAPSDTICCTSDTYYCICTPAAASRHPVIAATEA